MKNNILLEQVKISSKFETEEEVKIFEEGVWELVKNIDEDMFTELLNLFDDDTDYPEVMFSLAHALESLPDEFYIFNLLKNISTSLDKCPEWYSGLFIAALNNKNCINIIQKKLIDISKFNLENLILSVHKLSPDHANLIQELRKELNK